MRIISGKYKGLTLLGESISGTRPTMDRVKESMFGTIQNSLKNSVCLDLFAGSGSLGLEAISNGAKKVYFVDNNKLAIDTIKKNILKNKITEEIHLLNMDYNASLKKFKNENTKFDIIFLDPPYDYLIIHKIIKLVKKYDLLNKDGIIVCEYEKDILSIEEYKLFREKKIASKKVNYYINERVDD